MTDIPLKQLKEQDSQYTHYTSTQYPNVSQNLHLKSSSLVSVSSFYMSSAILRMRAEPSNAVFWILLLCIKHFHDRYLSLVNGIYVKHLSN